MSLDRAGLDALLARPELARLLAALDGRGEEVRVVGGAIRNALLGRPIRDIDLATTARPGETSRRAAAAGFRSIPTGIDHGTVTVLVEGHPFEVTTLREDVETDGRHAVVRFGRDFAADARRRDFTVNALFLDRAGTVHDAVGGLADLSERRIRFIGEADARIREDYLRVLRFFRFHAEYGSGAPDRAGFEASIRGRDGLSRLSAERVRAELFKLLVAPGGPAAAGLLQEAGLLGRLVRAVGEPGRLARAAAADRDGIGRLAAFLVRTEEDAGGLRDALRLSNTEEKRLSSYAAVLARCLSRPAPIDLAEVRRLAFLFEADPLRDVLAATAGEPRPAWIDEGRRALAAVLDGSAPVPHFPLTGADLLRRGLTPGPEIGRRLAEARAAWLAAGCPEGEVPSAASC